MAKKRRVKRRNNSVKRIRVKRTNSVKIKSNYGRAAELKFGQKLADIVTGFCGSWTFIVIVLVFMAVWMYMNVMMVMRHWDPYPFILLNFVLSCLAALQAPVILMSQNRQAERDRARAERDYFINRKAEKETQKIMGSLEYIKNLLGVMRKKR